MRRRWWLVAIPVAVLLVAVVGPWVYIHVIEGDPPAELGFDDVTSGGTAAREGIDGGWSVADGSVAGYRVGEVLFGQDTEAVGRTSDVTGSLVIDGTTVESAQLTVDLSTVESDQANRDNQFSGRIMDVATFPTATFELTEPIALDGVPADQEEVTVEATGDLTVRGVTNSVTFELTARRNGGSVEATGSIPVAFDDYGIPSPSFGPATVQDHGEIEFALTFSPT